MLRTGDRFLLFPAICHTIYKEIYVISKDYTLGIDIGSTTVKIAILDPGLNLMFADYCRHHADIRGTLRLLVVKAREQLGDITVHPVITGSGGLTLTVSARAVQGPSSTRWLPSCRRTRPA